MTRHRLPRGGAPGGGAPGGRAPGGAPGTLDAASWRSGDLGVTVSDTAGRRGGSTPTTDLLLPPSISIIDEDDKSEKRLIGKKTNDASSHVPAWVSSRIARFCWPWSTRTPRHSILHGDKCVTDFVRQLQQ